MFGSPGCKVVMSTCWWYNKDGRKRSACWFWLESDESLLPLHYSQDCTIWACTSSSRQRYLGGWGTWSLFQGWCQEVVRLISRWSCWVRAGESLGAQLVCVSAGFKHSCCSLEAAEVGASKQAHQLISPLPPPTLHFATLPSSPLLQIPSYLFAHGLTSCTHNKFSRERERNLEHI